MNKKFITLLLIIMLSAALTACGSAENPSGDNNDEQSEQEPLPPYTDMSEYKGVGGYVIENNVFDYTGVFDTVYDWEDGVKMPFPKPEGVRGHFDYAYSLPDMPRGQLKTYGEELETNGYTTVWGKDESGFEILLVYNEEFQAVLFENPYPSAPSEESYEIFVFVYTGFVKNPILKNREVRRLIEDNRLLEGNERFEQYYILPIENESIRKAGYYECLVFSEEYNFKHEAEDSMFYTPYYLIIKEGEVCLFEQAVYSPLKMSSATLYEDNGTERLVLTATYGIDGTSGITERTGIFIYELENGKFIKKEQKVYRSGGYLIARVVNGEIRLCYLIYNNHLYDAGTQTYSHTEYEDGHNVRDGRRYEYKLHGDRALGDMELYDIEECFSEGIFDDV